MDCPFRSATGNVTEGDPMNVVRTGLVFLVVLTGSVALGAGFAHDENFIIYATNQALADTVRIQANLFREEIAKQWLGQELPPGAGRTILSAELSHDDDVGFTWPIDQAQRKFHKTWLKTSYEKATGSTLRHECCHLVLNTRYRDPLPTWIEEGIASRYDDPERIAARQRLVEAYVQDRTWPDLRPVLSARVISPDNQSAYCVAGSLVEYLLTRGDKAKLLEFAAAIRAKGLDQALHECYGIHSEVHLESGWRAWTSQAASGRGASAPMRVSATPHGPTACPSAR
jgi:hypothetical protein